MLEIVESCQHERNALILLEALSGKPGSTQQREARNERQEVSTKLPSQITEILEQSTSHQRALFTFMQEHASPDGEFSMRYKEISNGCGVPTGSINYVAESLCKRGLLMLARPGGAGEAPIFQVANGRLLNQGA